MTVSGLNRLFDKTYSTVETTNDFKIIGPVHLPIKVKHDEKGELQSYLFAGKHENYIVSIFGDIYQSNNLMVRISSACVYGFILNSLLCDCHDQYNEAVAKILNNGSGILIYCLDQHGKGIGLEAHFLVYAEGQRQKKGLFKEIYHELGLAVDYRDYDETFKIIEYFKQKGNFEELTLLTEAPDKIKYFKKKCLSVGLKPTFLSFETKETSENKSELSEKVELGYHIRNSSKYKKAKSNINSESAEVYA